MIASHHGKDASEDVSVEKVIVKNSARGLKKSRTNRETSTITVAEKSHDGAICRLKTLRC